jgi:hypothetical protein
VICVNDELQLRFDNVILRTKLVLRTSHTLQNIVMCRPNYY